MVHADRRGLRDYGGGVDRALAARAVIGRLGAVPAQSYEGATLTAADESRQVTAPNFGFSRAVHHSAQALRCLAFHAAARTVLIHAGALAALIGIGLGIYETSKLVAGLV